MAQRREIPKRFWWTKRIFALWLLLVAAMLITRCVWDHLAEQRLSDELAVVQAHGERLDWVNMAQPRLPAEQNAAAYYRQAFAAAPSLRQGNQLSLLDDLSAIPSFRAKHVAEAEAMLADNSPVFDLSRQARSMPGVDWGVMYTSPTAAMAFPTHYSRSRSLAKLLRLQATWQVEHGDSAGAVETLLDCEALARSAGGDGLLIGYMMSISIQTANADSVAEIAPLLNITAGPATTQPVDYQAMRALLAQMLDGSSLASLRRIVVLIRAGEFDAAEWVRTGGSYSSFLLGRAPWYCKVSDHVPACWLLAPMRRMEQAYMLTYFRDLQDAASQPSFVLAEQHKRIADPDTLSPWLVFRRVLAASTYYPQYGGALRIPYLATARQRMAAIALALRLFELEKGRAAESLEQLVPEYLPSVPQDPFDPAGGAIRALLADAKPRLYSLGENKLDDGGATTSLVSGRPADIVLFLHPGDRPEDSPRSVASQPTSEPSTAPGPLSE